MTKPNITDQIAENMRFYGEMRFKQLTLLMAWLTIAGAGVAQFGKTVIVCHIKLKMIIAAASILVTGIIWVMEIRPSIFWVVHRSAFPELWPLPSKDFLPWINATSVVLGFYIAVYLFWLWCAHEWSLTYIPLILGSGGFIFLLVFSIKNYRRYSA